MNTIGINSKDVKMIAHRGLSGIERENTCSAFVAAGNRSYFGIETDVHKTADGRFVIIHDETTERVSLGKININVEKSNYDDVKDVVLPDLDESENRQDIRIPLLEDYIRICKKYEKICVLELKNPFERADIEKILSQIDAFGYLSNVIFISFDFNNCTILRSLLPDNDIQWLIGDDVTDEIIDTLVSENLNLDVYYKHITPELVSKLHSKGIAVNCWTCDSKDEAEKLVEAGVDFITTNILE